MWRWNGPLEQRRVDTPDHDLGTVGVLRDGPRFVVVCYHQPLHKLDWILDEWGGKNQQYTINAIIIMCCIVKYSRGLIHSWQNMSCHVGTFRGCNVNIYDVSALFCRTTQRLIKVLDQKKLGHIILKYWFGMEKVKKTDKAIGRGYVRRARLFGTGLVACVGS